MILRGDIAQRCAQVNARLIHAAIAKLHLVRLGAGGQCQQLVAETNAENRTVHFERSAQIGNRGCATRGVAGTIAEKEA